MSEKGPLTKVRIGGLCCWWQDGKTDYDVYELRWHEVCAMMQRCLKEFNRGGPVNFYVYTLS